MNGIVQQCTCGWIGLATTSKELLRMHMTHNFDAVTNGHWPKREMALSGLRIEDFEKFRASLNGEAI